MNAATFLQLVSAVPLDEVTAECVPSVEEASQQALTRAKAALARRRQRAKLFGELRLIDGPGWEMLVDLYICQLEGKDLCIGSVCVTSGVPMTNAVRILSKLLDKGLIRRNPDPGDRRRCIIALGEDTREKLDRYFASS